MSIFNHPIFRWTGKKRGEVSAVFALIAIIDVLWGNAYPLDLFELNRLSLLCWALLITGVMIRVCGAGILHKKERLTMTGIYAMVKHPLYIGTSLIYLSFFLAFGNILLGLVLFILMILVVYYPRMLQEEDYLAKAFPNEFEQYKKIPRFLPNPLLLPYAIKGNGFSLKRAYKNLGVRSLWALILIPLFLKLLIRVKTQNLF